MVNFVTELTGL